MITPDSDHSPAEVAVTDARATPRTRVPNRGEVLVPTGLVVSGLLALLELFTASLQVAPLILAIPTGIVAMVALVTRTRWRGRERLVAMAIPFAFVLSFAFLVAHVATGIGAADDSGTCVAIDDSDQATGQCADVDGNPVASASVAPGSVDGFPLRFVLAIAVPPVAMVGSVVWLLRRLRQGAATDPALPMSVSAGG